MSTTPKNELMGLASDNSVKDTTDPKKQPAAKVELPTPSLSTYFGEAPVPVRAFFKAVKTAKLRRFEENDEQTASSLMPQNDPEGARLWALVSQSDIPEAVDHWVWSAVQNILRSEVKGDFDPLSRDSLTVLKSLHRQLSTGIQGKEKAAKRKGENLLRISVTWLVKKRALDPWEAFNELRVVFFPEGQAATRHSKRILTQGKLQEIKTAAAISGLAHEKVRAALSDRDEERRQKGSLQDRISRLEKENARVTEELRGAEEKSAALALELAALKQKLNDQQQHWGHDMTDVKAKQNSLLRDRLAPLLKDALDALEIEPPAPQVALKRIKSTIAAIGDALQ